MSLKYQFLGTGVLCYITFAMGLVYTWPSSTIVLFGSENTTLSRPMTETELSLFGSLSSIGALVATPFSGYLMDKIGRRYLTLSISVMQVVTWSIIAVSKSVEMILLSCVVSGIGSCGFVVFGVFACECCHESIRGAVTTAPTAAYSLGMMVSYWIGGSVDYDIVIYISLCIAAVGIILVLFLKESPTFLMANGLEEEAAKSVAFYRNTNIDSKEVQDELECIRRLLNPDLNDTSAKSNEVEKLNPESNTKQKLSTWQFIKQSESTRRAFGICFAIQLLAVFQGLAVILVYADPLFREAVPNLSSTLCAVLLALVSFVSALISTYFTDRAGRKVLLAYSSLAGSVCGTFLGLQLQLHWGPHWVTPMLIYIYSGLFTLGSGTIPFVLMAELFLPEVRAIASMLMTETLWGAGFVILYIFNPLVNLIGLAPVFYIFSAVCFITAVFTFIMIPETKGLPIDEIQLLFTKKNKKQRQP